MKSAANRIINSLKDKVVEYMQRYMRYVYRLCPVKKNKIVFINFNGRGLGCNPKYIALEMLKQKLPYDMVWLLNNMDEELPEGIRRARYGRLTGMYEVATARVIITNVKNDLYLVKKPRQYIIQTWHGSYTFKLLENDAAAVLPPKYLEESRKNSAMTDLFISNCRTFSECYRQAFWCQCEILESGLPRNDIYFLQHPEAKRRVREFFGIPADAKLVIYAPTFRDDGSTDVYGLDCEGVLKALEPSGDWRLLIRMHPNVPDCDSMFSYNDRVINATRYPDMQELLLISDVLITDYSSSVFEFASMGRPSYIFAVDVDEYNAMRGLNKAFFTMPYKVCRTNEELCEQLRTYTPEEGRRIAKEFNDYYGCVDDGHAAERVVEHIRKVVEG